MGSKSDVGSSFCVLHRSNPQRGAVNAEINLLAVENLELSKVLPLKPRVGQNVAMHVSATARNFFIITTFPVHSTSFSPKKTSPSFSLR